MAIKGSLNSLLSDSENLIVVKAFVFECLDFFLSHIRDDFSEVNIEDDSIKKPQEFTIRLWDRNDLITSLTQGDKTHCCISFKSGGNAIYRYIYKNNINLVEIVAKGKGVVGQAFVYVALPENQINYRYSYKRHVFLCIDNVEINNSYSDYAQDIAKNLQIFMEDYMRHIEPVKISDVLLGASLNDIEPPYNYRISIPLEILGYKEHYLDNRSQFYKFL